MEDLLLNIVKEASGQKLAHLRKTAQDAHGMYDITTTLKTINWIQNCLSFF